MFFLECSNCRDNPPAYAVRNSLWHSIAQTMNTKSVPAMPTKPFNQKPGHRNVAQKKMPPTLNLLQVLNSPVKTKGIYMGDLSSISGTTTCSHAASTGQDRNNRLVGLCTNTDARAANVCWQQRRFARNLPHGGRRQATTRYI